MWPWRWCRWWWYGVAWTLLCLQLPRYYVCYYILENILLAACSVQTKRNSIQHRCSIYFWLLLVFSSLILHPFATAFQTYIHNNTGCSKLQVLSTFLSCPFHTISFWTRIKKLVKRELDNIIALGLMNMFRCSTFYYAFSKTLHNIKFILSLFHLHGK